jgi:hypothetical protein
VLHVFGSAIVMNVAQGASAEGGGIWSAGTLIVERSKVAGNVARAVGTQGVARGGGVHQGKSLLRLRQTKIFENIAVIVYPALSRNGGGIYVAAAAIAALEDCQLWGNNAGGRGFCQVDQMCASVMVKEQQISASHIASEGKLSLERCTVSDRSSSVLVDAAAEWWLVAISGTMVLRNSVFDAAIPVAAKPAQKLLNVFSADSEVLMINCTVVSLTLSSQSAKLAIVASTFAPYLNATNVTAIGPPDCGAAVAGETMCDPRALCEPRATGGVQCFCSGEGLQDKPGTAPDGRHCFQATNVDMRVLSHSVLSELRKPGNISGALHIVVEAKGENELVLQFHASMLRRRASVGADLQPSWTRNWSMLDEDRLELHGHLLIWNVPPSTDAAIDLDETRQKLADTKDYSFQLGIDCNSVLPCVEDGDTVETVISIGSATAPGRTLSEVHVMTHVRSLVSCRTTRVQIEGDLDSMLISSSFRVRVAANDVDELPVSFTRADIGVLLSNRNVPVQWKYGSNEYVADVQVDAQAGELELVVRANNAWSEMAGHATSCELLRRTITVKEGLSTSWIVAGASTTALLVVGTLVLIVRKRHAHLHAIMTMLLTEMGMLVFSICTALANLVTDGIVFGKMARGELAVPSEIFTVVYATILCFGIAATALSIGYRIRNARLMKVQLLELAPQGQAAATTAAQRQAQQHAWELVQTHRTKVTLSLSLASVAAQGVLAT